MAGPHSSPSLATRLLRRVFLWYLVIAASLTTAYLVFIYADARSRIVAQLQVYEKTFAEGLALNLWNLDAQEMYTIAKGMLELPYIVGISVRQIETGKFFVALGAYTVPSEQTGHLAESVSQAGLFFHDFPLYYTNPRETKKLGTARIYSDNALIIQSVWLDYLWVILIAIIKTVALWFIFLRISRRDLQSPLLTLAEATSRIDLDTLDQTRIDLKRVERDELSVLQDSFNQMLKKLLNARQTLEQFNVTLERQVAVRTRDLQESRRHMELALDAAETANQAKSAFLASMSHELRTPLNAILGYAGILQRNPEKLEEGIRIIKQSGSHLLNLLNDLLDLAKIEAGKLELDRHPVALPALLRDSVEIIRPRAGEKQLFLKLDLDDALPASVTADEKRLRQVLLNLLGNAVKFTDSGGVTLSALLDAPPLEKGEVQRICFSIQDTGIGISAADREKIFRPFEQARGGEGAGLGLDISRRLIALMGGEIRMQSEPGQGSRFHFSLALPVCASAPKPDVSPQITGYHGPRRRILIVDDNPDNRTVLGTLLASAGFVLTEAENGLQAVHQASLDPPDIILMDLMMPELDGFEATRRIHALPGLADLPVIAISASFPENDAKEIFQGFLHKPLDEAKLWDLLAERLGLSWEYTPESVGTAEIIAPPAAKLQELHDLARLGRMPRIRAWADGLEPEYAAFARQVRELAREFDDAGLMKLVKRYL